VVVIDGFSGDIGPIRSLAAALAPFPRSSNYYPGLRRVIGEPDAEAMAYVVDTLQRAAQFVAGGFDIERFALVQASFSMVTAPPASLMPAQRAPHFDSADPKHIAVLHYLSDTPGTAFYRQRSTGIERVDEKNRSAFIAAATREGQALKGYVTGSNAAFEQIGAVEGVADRLVIYQGALLHSGIIPPDLDLSPDPLTGRLTCNIFINGQ
jgi:hypothetical protein